MTIQRRTAVALLYLAIATGSANGQTIIHVDDDASVGGNGVTWSAAFARLQDALAVAASGDEIRVAQGTYKPDEDESGNVIPGNALATFQLKTGVVLKGGYAGTGAPNPNQRDIVRHETILSGDLTGDDVPVGCMQNSPDCDSLGSSCLNGTCIIQQGNSDNSFHVVTSSGTDDSAVIDGFTITGGAAKGGGSLNNGGGIYNFGGSPRVSNCTFIGNIATNSGGGMYSDGIRAPNSATLTNCTFRGNSAENGGGLFSGGVSVTLTDCTFTRNNAGIGGGLHNRLGGILVTGCMFSENSANEGGGMFHSLGGSTVRNSIFDNNSGGGIANHSIGNATTVTNCTFSDNTGSGISNFGGSPMVTDCVFRSNSATFGAGMFNSGSDPTVTNCTFTGNMASQTGGGIYNVISVPTVTNCTFSANSALSGAGIINLGQGRAIVTNSIFWHNSAPGGRIDESAQIDDAGNFASRVNYSNVQGGWTGVGGNGNIDADPLFVDADGPDNAPGTDDDDLRLLPSSPCIDAGDNTAVPSGVTTDLLDNPRFFDEPGTLDTGIGPPPVVDMGAVESGATSPPMHDVRDEGGRASAPLCGTMGGLSMMLMFLSLAVLRRRTNAQPFSEANSCLSVTKGQNRNSSTHAGGVIVGVASSVRHGVAVPEAMVPDREEETVSRNNVMASYCTGFPVALLAFLALASVVGCGSEAPGDGSTGGNGGDGFGVGGSMGGDNAEPPPFSAIPTGETLTLDLGGGVVMEMIRIPAGTFMMGSENGRSDERPVHSVTITQDFWLGKYEVTMAQYEAVIGRNPSRRDPCGCDLPVDNVSWDDAVEFTQALSVTSGYDVRLPTEAEWEYACRAGTTTEYSFGDDSALLHRYAWYAVNNSGNPTNRVGQKNPNPWGLFDMHGNMWEFCSDQYHWAYYLVSPSTDPRGPLPGGPLPVGISRVIRGGSFILDADGLRSAARGAAREPHGAIGFRVAAGS